jgi:phospholipid/cholesterol/gamma-HCH transport system permease protein
MILSNMAFFSARFRNSNLPDGLQAGGEVERAILERTLIHKSLISLETVGSYVSARVETFLNIFTLLYLAFRVLWTERKKGLSLVFEITLRQIYFTGVQAIRVVTVVSLALGAVTIIQTGTRLTFMQGAELEVIVPVLIVVILRELGPLLTAIIVIMRSGTAIATELGNMIVSHEFEAIQAMGIQSVYFIVTPRVIGVTMAVICLTIFFNAIALLGGFGVAKLILPITFPAFLLELQRALSVGDFLLGFLKSVIFGFLIALSCTYHGLTVQRSPIEVPQVATRGVVSATLFCFATDALLTTLFYL